MSKPTTNLSRLVLVAEDDEGDALLLRLAFKRAEIPHQLVIVNDGQIAIDYLNGNPPYADRALHPLPALVLLDLKMPRLNGFDVLAWWGARPDLRAVPVVILSSSTHPSDMAKTREMGARDYIVKPHGFAQLSQLLQELSERWLSLACVCL